MTLPPESLAALRDAASTRPDIERLVLVEQRVEPRSEEPFTDVCLVVVLSDPPSESPGFEPMRELARLLIPAVAGVGNLALSVPSSAAIAADTRDGVVVYERGADA